MKAQKTETDIPEVTIDKSLERFRGKVLFPEKLRKINEILATAVPPKAPIKVIPSDKSSL